MNKKLLHFAIIAALFTQVGHTATVFNNLSGATAQGWDAINGYIFAVSLEMAIYLFTCRGKLAQARFFGIMSFLVNVMFYHKTNDIDFMAVCSLFFSAIIPVTIWFYAKLLHEMDESTSEAESRIYELESELTAIKQAESERLTKLAVIAKKRKESEAKKADKKKKRQKVSTVEATYLEPLTEVVI